MSRPKSLNISDFGTKTFFQNWSGGFGVIPNFHFFEVLKNFSFLGLSREPFEIP